MNTFSLNKALVDHLEEYLSITGGLPPLFKSGSSEIPPASTKHLMEYVISGETDTIGISDTDSNITRGFYQIDINFPKRQGRFGLLADSDKVSLGFPKGLLLTHGEQQIKIGVTTWSPVRENDLSNVVSLRIRFSVIG